MPKAEFERDVCFEFDLPRTICKFLTVDDPAAPGVVGSIFRQDSLAVIDQILENAGVCQVDCDFVALDNDIGPPQEEPDLVTSQSSHRDRSLKSSISGSLTLPFSEKSSALVSPKTDISGAGVPSSKDSSLSSFKSVFSSNDVFRNDPAKLFKSNSNPSDIPSSHIASSTEPYGSLDTGSSTATDCKAKYQHEDETPGANPEIEKSRPLFTGANNPFRLESLDKYHFEAPPHLENFIERNRNKSNRYNPQPEIVSSTSKFTFSGTSGPPSTNFPTSVVDQAQSGAKSSSPVAKPSGANGATETAAEKEDSALSLFEEFFGRGGAQTD